MSNSIDDLMDDIPLNVLLTMQRPRQVIYEPFTVKQEQTVQAEIKTESPKNEFNIKQEQTVQAEIKTESPR